MLDIETKITVVLIINEFAVTFFLYNVWLLLITIIKCLFTEHLSLKLMGGGRVFMGPIVCNIIDPS